jgi:hypothetical protein
MYFGWGWIDGSKYVYLTSKTLNTLGCITIFSHIFMFGALDLDFSNLGIALGF